MVKAKCKICGKLYPTKPNWQKRGRRCCSMKCRNEAQKTGVSIKCNTCSKKIWRTQSELRKSNSGYFFCNKRCQTIWRNKHYSSENHAMWQNGRGSYRNRLAKSNAKKICRGCGIHDFRVLIAHHKDRDREHNDINNLEWLCHNCHFLEHNYK